MHQLTVTHPDCAIISHKFFSTSQSDTNRIFVVSLYITFLDTGQFPRRIDYRDSFDIAQWPIRNLSSRYGDVTKMYSWPPSHYMSIERTIVCVQVTAYIRGTEVDCGDRGNHNFWSVWSIYIYFDHGLFWETIVESRDILLRKKKIILGPFLEHLKCILIYRSRRESRLSSS